MYDTEAPTNEEDIDPKKAKLYKLIEISPLILDAKNLLNPKKGSYPKLLTIVTYTNKPIPNMVNNV